MAGSFHAHLRAIENTHTNMLGCQSLKNDDCDRCTDDFSHFLGLKC